MYSILAMGYYISYTILDFPDLTVEGTVLSGGITFGLLVRAGINPWLAMLAAFAVGFIFGALTGILHVKLKIRPLLCGILVSTGLISVNLITTVVGMGGNFAGDGALSTIDVGRGVPTLIRTFPANLLPTDVGGFNLRKLVTFFVIALLFKLLLDGYLKTKNGLLLRAAGDNEKYVAMLAKNAGNSKILGLAIGNAYAAVSGALIVQSRGNVNQGIYQFRNMAFVLKDVLKHFKRSTPTGGNNVNLIYFGYTAAFDNIIGHGISMPHLFLRLLLHPMGKTTETFFLKIERHC